MTELPTYAEARSECLENDNPSCLAWFITEHEGGRPGSLEEQTFRADLAAAIEEAKGQGFREAEGMFDAWKRHYRESVAVGFSGELHTSLAIGFFCGVIGSLGLAVVACLYFFGVGS